tara:strand:- start:53 stop:430 length:378 start_codon:yes stop_codon:yes gene_type:complete
MAFSPYFAWWQSVYYAPDPQTEVTLHLSVFSSPFSIAVLHRQCATFSGPAPRGPGSVDSGGGLPSAFSILHCGSKETSNSLGSRAAPAAAGTAVVFSISIVVAELGSTIVVRMGDGDTCQKLCEK